MKIYRATSVDTAIQLGVKDYQETDADSHISKYLDEIFGRNNGDYFVIASQTRTDIKGRKFRLVLVEDKDMDKHQLFFQLIKLDS